MEYCQKKVLKLPNTTLLIIHEGSKKNKYFVPLGFKFVSKTACSFEEKHFYSDLQQDSCQGRRHRHQHCNHCRRHCSRRRHVYVPMSNTASQNNH